MTKIKICGLVKVEDVQAVNQAQADYAGFIFAPGRHQLSLKQALKLRQHLDSHIPSVGVFMDAPLEEILQAFDSGAISLIQLHGNESEGAIKALHAKHVPVIKVFKPNTIRKTSADFIMIDSGAGNGKLIDWQKITVKTNKPLIIASSIDSRNVQIAIKQVKPTIVDLSRGVETDGKKDPQKISQIVNLVHSI